MGLLVLMVKLFRTKGYSFKVVIEMKNNFFNQKVANLSCSQTLKSVNNVFYIPLEHVNRFLDIKEIKQYRISRIC